MPSDEIRYYERATSYRALAEQTTRLELRPVYRHLAAGYDRLAQFHEDVRILLAPVAAPLGGDGIATFDAVVPHQFPSPWSIQRTATGWRVTDATGQPLVSVDGNDDRGAGTGLTIDEAQWLAVNIAQLPELIRRAAAGGSL